MHCTDVNFAVALTIAIVAFPIPPPSSLQVRAELHKQWSRFLLAKPFIGMPCFLGRNFKYLGRCPKKSPLNNNCVSLEVTPPQNVPMAGQRAGCDVELSPALRHNPKASLSDSSEGDFTTGETMEEVFEESAI